MHRPAAPAREAIAVDQDEIDIGGLARHALVKDCLPFCSHFADQPRGNAGSAPRHFTGSLKRKHGFHRERRSGGSVTRIIVIPAGTAFLPLATGPHQSVGQRLGHELACRAGVFAL